tara:strand:- start:429 stop:572 length:144 start_codon:yes stop_codon:yes gene_type:complete
MIKDVVKRNGEWSNLIAKIKMAHASLKDKQLGGWRLEIESVLPICVC